MALWKQYFPIWIGEFSISLAANNIDLQRTINTAIINWAVINHVGFSIWTVISNPSALEQQWTFNDEALQASIYARTYTLKDLIALANAYGSNSASPNWNPNCDLDGNGVVGLPDLIIMTLHCT